MFLRSLWERVHPPIRPRESVALDPVEQLSLRFLLSHGPTTEGSLHTEVNSTRVASASDVHDALARLEGLGLVESRIRLEGDQSRVFFSPSGRASKLKGRIPLEPQAVTEFYL
jgi:hypothetical protein